MSYNKFPGIFFFFLFFLFFFSCSAVRELPTDLSSVVFASQGSGDTKVVITVSSDSFISSPTLSSSSDGTFDDSLIRVRTIRNSDGKVITSVQLKKRSQGTTGKNEGTTGRNEGTTGRSREGTTGRGEGSNSETSASALTSLCFSCFSLFLLSTSFNLFFSSRNYFSFFPLFVLSLFFFLGFVSFSSLAAETETGTIEIELRLPQDWEIEEFELPKTFKLEKKRTITLVSPQETTTSVSPVGASSSVGVSSPVGVSSSNSPSSETPSPTSSLLVSSSASISFSSTITTSPSISPSISSHPL